MEKVTAIVTALILIGLIAFAAIFAIEEFRYFTGGRTTTGMVTDVNQEFSRFANDQVDGTKPIYRYRYSYSFIAEGDTCYHEMTSETSRYMIGDKLKIQYRTGKPQSHRVLTGTTQVYRSVFAAFIAVFFGMCIHGVIRVWRSPESITDSSDE